MTSKETPALIFLSAVFTIAFGAMFFIRVGRGKKITRTRLNKQNFIPVEPFVLADSVFLHVDVYSLARCIASEHPLGTEYERAAIAHAILNEAQRRGIDVTNLLIRKVSRNGNLLPGNGFYGRQAGRHASTALDPRESDVVIALNAITGRSIDITNGSQRFLHSSQDELLKKRVPGYNRTFAQVKELWMSEGWNPVNVPQMNDWQFFRKAA